MRAITGEELAQALTIITTNKRIGVIREVYKDLYDQNVDIPEFQKPLCETFDYLFYKLLLQIEANGTIDQIYNWALEQLELKKSLDFKQK